MAAAARAFPDWRRTPGIERAEKLHHAARRIREDAEGLAILLTREGGKPLPENRDEVEWIAASFDYYAEIGRDAVGRVISPVARNQFNFVIKEPYGVVRADRALELPAAAAGLEAGAGAGRGQHRGGQAVGADAALDAAPDAVLRGAARGRGQRRHRLRRGGGRRRWWRTARSRWSPSPAARPRAAQVAVTCAEQLKKCHLELGGNDPFIVDEGVDLDVAARGAVWACFLNMGQVCTSAERFYVLDRVFDEFVDRFVAFTKTLRIGDPLGPGRRPGPDGQRGPAREGREEGGGVGGGGGAGDRRRPAAGALRQGLLLRADRARSTCTEPCR